METNAEISALTGKRKAGNFISAFMKWQKDTPSSDKFIMWVALSTLAGAVGRKTWINYNGFQSYPNLFVMLVGPAGLGKKTTIARNSYQLLQGNPAINLLPEALTPAALLMSMSEFSMKTRVRIKGEKRDFQYGGAYLFASEALNVLGAKTYGNMTEIMTELYDSDPAGWNTEIFYQKATVRDGVVKIYNPTLNFLGCTTPQTLTESIIKKSQIDSGFASRILFAVEEGSSGKATVWQDEEDMEAYNQTKALLREEIREIASLSGPFHVDKAVRLLHDKFVAENEQLALENQTNKLASFYGRRPIHVLKLSQLFSIARDSSMRIIEEDWVNAKAMVEQARADMTKLFEGVSKYDDSSLLYTIWEWARLKDSFTLPEVLNQFWHLAPAEKLKGSVFTLALMKRTLPINEGKIVIYKIIDNSKLK